MRGIVGYIFFFTVGAIAAGAYFYQIHPDQSLEQDLPRVRKDVGDAIERGKRLRDAWRAPEQDQTTELPPHERQDPPHDPAPAQLPPRESSVNHH